jgi:hypothetical protein
LAEPGAELRISVAPPDLFSQNRKSMGTAFSRTRQDVERYIRFRAAGNRLTQKIFDTAPLQAHYNIAEALGVLRNGVVELGDTRLLYRLRSEPQP